MVCTIEMPNADAEALLRFLKTVDTRSQSNGDPYEQSRLEAALEELTEAIEAGVGDA
ncbi:MAG: hypothetical protein V7772_06055 [Pseudomonas profundi]|uniref:hypothetical protein n=1 Tax=Pseudomonas profundi TaxID=1981513 RepID=UPI0030030DF0